MSCARLFSRKLLTVRQRGGPASVRRRTERDVGAFLGRCKRLGFCDTKTAKILNIFTNADDILFDAVMKNS